MRPSRLPIKKLKEHISRLKREHGLTLRRGSPHHDEIKRITYIPRIRTTPDYLVALHEIGHALDKRIQRMGNAMQDLKIKTYKIEIEGRNSISVKKLRQLTKSLEILCDRAAKIKNLLESDKWIWKGEKLAWDFAFKHSLVWNKSCQCKVEECMRSYWITRALADKYKWTLIKMMNGYWKFYLKYIQPIFSPNK